MCRTAKRKRDQDRLICRACFYSGLPEAALTWPRVEYVCNSAIFGSGESSQFGHSTTVRLDGRHIERDRGTYQSESREQTLARLFPGKELVPVDSLKGRHLYVIKPQPNERTSDSE
jgi:hypothetical protein